MANKGTIEQRIGDVRALLARHRIKLIEVAEEADVNYDSLRNNMRTNLLSDERMTAVEEAALRLHDYKKKALNL